jgi:microcystin degradation protein MlrC
MRIVTGTFSHETNTFATSHTTSSIYKGLVGTMAQNRALQNPKTQPRRNQIQEGKPLCFLGVAPR